METPWHPQGPGLLHWPPRRPRGAKEAPFARAVLRKSIPLRCPLWASDWYNAFMISQEMAFPQIKTPYHWLFRFQTPSAPGKITLEVTLTSRIQTQAISCTSPQQPVHLRLPASRPKAVSILSTQVLLGPLLCPQAPVQDCGMSVKGLNEISYWG